MWLEALRLEWRLLTRQPGWWVALAAIAAIAGYLHLAQLEQLRLLLAADAAMTSFQVEDVLLVPYAANAALLLLLACPLLYVRGYADERLRGTLVLWRGARLSLAQWWAAKALGLGLGLAVLWLLLVLIGASAALVVELWWPRVLLLGLALALLGCTALSIGLCASSLATTPMLGAMYGTLASFALYGIDQAPALVGADSGLLGALSLSQRMLAVANGEFGVHDLGYFVAISALCAALCVRQMARLQP